MVPKVGFEPTRANAHYALNVARLPFRHFGADFKCTVWTQAVSALADMTRTAADWVC